MRTIGKWILILGAFGLVLQMLGYDGNDKEETKPKVVEKELYHMLEFDAASLNNKDKIYKQWIEYAMKLQKKDKYIVIKSSTKYQIVLIKNKLSVTPLDD